MQTNHRKALHQIGRIVTALACLAVTTTAAAAAAAGWTLENKEHETERTDAAGPTEAQ